MVFYSKTSTHFLSYLAMFFLEWEMFKTNVVEKIKASIFFSNFFLSKIVPSVNKVAKHSRAEQASDDNVAYVHCMPDNKGFTHAHIK
jgi:hypothetical protein